MRGQAQHLLLLSMRKLHVSLVLFASARGVFATCIPLGTISWHSYFTLLLFLLLLAALNDFAQQTASKLAVSTTVAHQPQRHAIAIAINSSTISDFAARNRRARCGVLSRCGMIGAHTQLAVAPSLRCLHEYLLLCADSIC